MISNELPSVLYLVQREYRNGWETCFVDDDEESTMKGLVGLLGDRRLRVVSYRQEHVETKENRPAPAATEDQILPASVGIEGFLEVTGGSDAP